jgi:hypothetical protein
MVRSTTKAKRLVSTGFPDGITEASASKTGFVDSKFFPSPSARMYFPAARTLLSDTYGYTRLEHATVIEIVVQTYIRIRYSLANHGWRFGCKVFE